MKTRFLAVNSAIAFCDRCDRKVGYNDLRPDGNSPGLRVCNRCIDEKDRWKLTPRVTEVVITKNARPDVSIIAHQNTTWDDDSTFWDDTGTIWD